MRYRVILVSLGIASLLLYLGMTELSREFNWGQGYAKRPILEYLAVYFALFAAYAGAVALVAKRPDDRASFWIILAFGLLFRAVIFPSQQIQEDDVYRYLWDGKAFANGINPYEYAPKQVDTFKSLKIREPETFRRVYGERNVRDLERLYALKWENEIALRFQERVNHPDVPTIYPPLAQYVFRAVAQIRPDSILALRAAFLAFDLAALAFIVLTLDALGKSKNLGLVYFWSPLVIKETFNSTHLDIIGISLLCVSIYFFVRARLFAATFFLALSALGKFYPAILLPFYLREMIASPRPGGWPPRAFAGGGGVSPALGALLFAGTVGLAYLPFLDIGPKAFEGLRTYATRWENNDSVFAILVYFYGDVLGLKTGEGLFLANNLAVFLSKATVAAILLGTLLCLLFRKRDGAPLKEIFVLMALAFLLSPVQNPWYLCWLVPFLCVFPGRSWILLTGLVGLYYLDFYFDYREMRQFSRWIPWLEYAPFYLLLAADCRKIFRGAGFRPGPA